MDQIPEKKMEFAVEMRSPCCGMKVKDALEGLAGIKSVSIDVPTQRLLVEGDVLADTVRDTVEKKTGMSTVLLGHGSSHNLGAGVAAISIGNSGVQGLLRFIQVEPNKCFLEGTLDKLPTNEPVFLTVHETGDVSEGCISCGSLYQMENNGQAFSGILKQLEPNEMKRAEFRLSIPNIKLLDLIGHCVVVHQGNQREVEENKSQSINLYWNTKDMRHDMMKSGNQRNPVFFNGWHVELWPELRVCSRILKDFVPVME